MTRTWNDNEGKIAIELNIDDVTGIVLKISQNIKNNHASEIEELQTLNMYPPKDEEKIAGIDSDDGEWTTYEMKKGKNWEYAKKDIVNTCEFWMCSPRTNQLGGQENLIVME